MQKAWWWSSWPIITADLYQGHWDPTTWSFPAWALEGQRRDVTDDDTVGGISWNNWDALYALIDGPSTSVYTANWFKFDNTDPSTVWMVRSVWSTTNGTIAVRDAWSWQYIRWTNVSIDRSNNVSWVALLSGQKFAFTIDETAILGNTFYYADYIQNWFVSSAGTYTGDMSNLFTGIYWKWAGTYTRNAWWYGLSGNQVFLWHQGTAKIDGAQALAPTVLFNSGRLWWDIAAVRAYFSNRGTIDSASYYSGEYNSYIWWWGIFTELYAMHFKTGSLTGASVVQWYGVVIEDDVPNEFGWQITSKRDITTETNDLTGVLSWWYYHDYATNILTSTTNATIDFACANVSHTARQSDYDLTTWPGWITWHYSTVINSADPWVVDRMFAHIMDVALTNAWSEVSDIAWGVFSTVTGSWIIDKFAHFMGTDAYFSWTINTEYAVYFPSWSLLMWNDIRGLYFEDNIKHKLSGTTYLQIWSSAGFAEAWLTLDVQYTPVGNVGTGADDLMTYTLPAYALKTGKWVRIKWRWTYANNANVKYMSAVFGGTSLATQWATLSQAGEWCYEIDILYDGSASQTYFLKFKQTWSQESIFSWSTTADETNSIIIKFTGEWVANNDVVQQWQIIEFL